MVAGVIENIKANIFATTKETGSICSGFYISPWKMPIEDIVIEGFVEPENL
jgi:hypothetical protein